MQGEEVIKHDDGVAPDESVERNVEYGAPVMHEIPMPSGKYFAGLKYKDSRGRMYQVDENGSVRRVREP